MSTALYTLCQQFDASQQNGRSGRNKKGRKDLERSRRGRHDCSLRPTLFAFSCGKYLDASRPASTTSHSHSHAVLRRLICMLQVIFHAWAVPHKLKRKKKRKRAVLAYFVCGTSLEFSSSLKWDFESFSSLAD